MLTSTAAAALVVPFILQADLQGKLYRSDCDREPPAPMLAVFGDGVQPVTLSAGDLLGPAPEARFAVEHGGDSHAALAAVLGGRLDAILPGNFELSIDRPTLAALTQRAQLPFTIANLAPGFPTQTERVVERGGAKIGITGAIHDDLGVHLSHRTKTEKLVPAAPALVASIRRLRTAGASLVVALVHVSPKRGTSEVVRLVEQLGDDRPDLILTSGLAGDVRSLSVGDLLVVPAPERGAALIEVALPSRTATLREALPPAPADPALAALRDANCRELGLRMTEVTTPLAREDFTRYVLEVMRRETDAEIAIINNGAFGSGFPLSGAVDRLRLLRAIRVDDGLQLAHVRGSDVPKLLPTLANPGATVLGLEAGKVVGRDIDPTRRYRVVTVDFVAMGGDALLPAGIVFAPVEGEPLRDRVRRFLTERGAALAIEQPALLGATLSLAGNLKTVTVENDANYGEPQLARESFLGVSAFVDLRLYADFDRHKVEITERTRYGIAKDGDEDAFENDDLTIVELNYLGRFAVRGHAFWIPDASASVSIETELTKPEERGFHRALLTGGAGPSWALADRISLRVQLGVRRDLLARADSPDPLEAEVADTRLALLTTLELLRIDFPTELGSAVLLNLRIDHALDLTSDVRDHTLRGRFDVDVPITSLLALTAGLEVYVLDRLESGVDRESAVAFDTSIGLKTSGDLGLVLF